MSFRPLVSLPYASDSLVLLFVIAPFAADSSERSVCQVSAAKSIKASRAAAAVIRRRRDMIGVV